MLTNFGAQQTIRNGLSAPQTTKYSSGAPISRSTQLMGVVGSYSSDEYNSTKCYFLSRGASIMYADAMTALVIDTAQLMGISPQSVLEQSTINKKFDFSNGAYSAINMLRDPGNQIGKATPINNRNSLKARELLS
jgi:hypothetical protein